MIHSRRFASACALHQRLTALHRHYNRFVAHFSRVCDCCMASILTCVMSQSFVVDVMPLERRSDEAAPQVAEDAPTPPARPRTRDAWSLEPSIPLLDAPSRCPSFTFSSLFIPSSSRVPFSSFVTSCPAPPPPPPLPPPPFALAGCVLAKLGSSKMPAVLQRMTLKLGAVFVSLLSCPPTASPQLHHLHNRLHGRPLAPHRANRFACLRLPIPTAGTPTACHRRHHHRLPLDV